MAKKKKSNVGEMSELYTMFRLATERKLQLANADFSEIPDAFMEIREVIRNGKDGELVVNTDDDEKLHVLLNGKEKFTISYGDMGALADETYREMITDKNYEKAELFLDDAGCTCVKASSTTKTDISLKVHDPRTGTDPTVKYSIKSDVGNDSSLYNATKDAYFTFEIDGPITDDIMKKVNSFKNSTKVDDSEITSKTQGKVKKKFVYLSDKGCSFKLIQEDCPFHNNLMYVDTKFPEVLATMTCYYYSHRRVNRVDEITEAITKLNPLNISESIKESWYEYNMKNFLVLAALGMTQGSLWDVRESVTGGIVLVKDTGKIVCYHLFDRNEFENHLYYMTKFDTPSTSRHSDAVVVKTIDGKYRISVGMQIRFNKTKGEDTLDQ